MLCAISAVCLLPAKKFPIAALGILNDDVDDASVNHKSKAKGLVDRASIPIPPLFFALLTNFQVFIALKHTHIFLSIDIKFNATKTARIVREPFFF